MPGPAMGENCLRQYPPNIQLKKRKRRQRSGQAGSGALPPDQPAKS